MAELKDSELPVTSIVDKKTTTQKQILQAALTCFANKGYHKTTMDDIVLESGLSKGALYWHFKGKRELFISLIDWIFLDLSEEATHIWTEDMSGSDKIRAMMMFFVDESEQFLPLYKIILDFWAQTLEDEQIQQIFHEVLEKFSKKLMPIIETGIAAGEFRPVNSFQVALGLIALLDAMGLYKNLLGDKIELHDTVETMLDLVIVGLKP